MTPTNFYWHRAKAQAQKDFQENCDMCDEIIKDIQEEAKRCAINCASCGKFVAYKNGIHGTCVYTPDSHYSSETIEWFCSKCNDRSS